MTFLCHLGQFWSKKPFFLAIFVQILFLGSLGSKEPWDSNRTLVSAELLTAMRANQEGKLATIIRQIERSFAAGDPRYLDSIFDRDAVLERATGPDTPQNEREIRQIFATGTKQAWDRSSPAVDYLGQDFHFLRVHKIKGTPGLLFRAMTSNGTLNYLLFCIKEDESGKLWIADIFSMGMNEFTSQALQRTYRYLVQHFVTDVENGQADLLDDGRNANEAAASIASQYVENLPKIAKVTVALGNQNGDAALDVLESLPALLQTDRSILLMKLDAAQIISKARKQQVLTQWNTQFPDQAELPLRWAEAHMDEKRWGEAKRLLEIVCSRIGGDSFLQFQIGQLTMQMRPKPIAMRN